MRAREVIRLMQSSINGEIEPHGRIAEADSIVGFSFGVRYDEGHYTAPGATNEALGTWLADQFKPQRLMILQQELADVVCDIQPDASQAVVALPTMKSSGCTFSTHELIGQIRRKYTIAQLGKIGLCAFRYHMPRVDAQMKHANFETIVDPSLQQVGDFDPQSSQVWTQNSRRWSLREPLVILQHAYTHKL